MTIVDFFEDQALEDLAPTNWQPLAEQHASDVKRTQPKGRNN
jgi:hypothetical protein